MAIALETKNLLLRRRKTQVWCPIIWLSGHLYRPLPCRDPAGSPVQGIKLRSPREKLGYYGAARRWEFGAVGAGEAKSHRIVDKNRLLPATCARSAAFLHWGLVGEIKQVGAAWGTAGEWCAPALVVGPTQGQSDFDQGPQWKEFAFLAVECQVKLAGEPH